MGTSTELSKYRQRYMTSINLALPALPNKLQGILAREYTDFADLPPMYIKQATLTTPLLTKTYSSTTNAGVGEQ